MQIQICFLLTALRVQCQGPWPLPTWNTAPGFIPRVLGFKYWSNTVDIDEKCESMMWEVRQWFFSMVSGGGIRGFWLLPMFVSYLADLVKIHRNARTCIFFCIYLHLFYSKNFKDSFVWGSKHLVLIFCSFYLYGQCLLFAAVKFLSCVWLFVSQTQRVMDCRPPGFLEWVAMPFSGGSSLPRDRIHIS